jgi:hypothetical protein
VRVLGGGDYKINHKANLILVHFSQNRNPILHAAQLKLQFVRYCSPCTNFQVAKQCRTYYIFLMVGRMINEEVQRTQKEVGNGLLEVQQLDLPGVTKQNQKYSESE